MRGKQDAKHEQDEVLFCAGEIFPALAFQGSLVSNLKLAGAPSAWASLIPSPAVDTVNKRCVSSISSIPSFGLQDKG